MQNRARVVKKESISLNGLEEVFDVDTTVITEVDQADINGSNQAEITGLTIKQASKYYGLAVPTVRLKIKLGDIPAVKLNGSKGPEWRVFPKGVPTELSETDINVHTAYQQADTSETEDWHQPDRNLSEGFYQANMNVANLIKANQEMAAKLESAIYRNGYLEAQLEAERSQVKLLTDSLQQALKEEPAKTTDLATEPVSGWQKFCSWLIGKRSE